MPIVAGTRGAGRYSQTLAEYARKHGPRAVLELDPARVVPIVADRRDALALFRERYHRAPGDKDARDLETVRAMEGTLAALAYRQERDRAARALGTKAPTATADGNALALGNGPAREGVRA